MDAPRGTGLSESEATLNAGQQGAPERGTLVDFLRASRTELDSLLAKSREIQQESLRNVNASFEELHSKLYQQLEEASASFVNETRRRAEYEMSSLLELFDVETDARLAARLDEALAKARAACAEMELGVNKRTELQSEEALAKLSGLALKELQSKTEAMVEGFRAELQSTLNALKSETVNEVSEQLRKTSGKLADDLQSRADKAYGALSAQLTAAGKAVMAETEKQIAALAQTTLANLGQQAEEVHRRTSEFVVRDLRKRLDQVGNALQQLEAGAVNIEATEHKG